MPGLPEPQERLPTRRIGRRALVRAAPLSAALALVPGCSRDRSRRDTGTDSEAPSSGSETTGPEPEVEVVASGLQAPWSIAFHGDVALVSERDTARILELDAEGTTRTVGGVDGVEPGGEAGLLGILVHEDQLFAYSTAADGNRIQRFALTGAPGRLALGPAETILDGLASASTHNGGRLGRGPDGMLYATVGDAGEHDSGQDPKNPNGSILRMTPDGEVPDDNPTPGSLVYSYGHRNPQGLAWTPDGTLLASEFGQDTWDELNVIEPGTNYGWPEVEGIAHDDRFTDPVQQWRPAEASPSGIAIHEDTLVVANLRGERLRRIPLDDLSAAEVALAGEYGRLRDVTVTPGGELWVLTGNTDGRGTPKEDDDRILRVKFPGTP